MQHKQARQNDPLRTPQGTPRPSHPPPITPASSTPLMQPAVNTPREETARASETGYQIQWDLRPYRCQRWDGDHNGIQLLAMTPASRPCKAKMTQQGQA